MKNPAIAYVGWLLIIAASVFYGYGILEAIALSVGDKSIDKDAYPAILSSTVSSVQALLLTNLGVLLGISVAKPGSAVARQLMLSGKISDQQKLEPTDPLELKDKIQLFALVVYVISLIICLIVWGMKKFSLESTVVVSVIPESGKMFIAVTLAYLTAVLKSN